MRSTTHIQISGNNSVSSNSSKSGLHVRRSRSAARTKFYDGNYENNENVCLNASYTDVSQILDLDLVCCEAENGATASFEDRSTIPQLPQLVPLDLRVCFEETADEAHLVNKTARKAECIALQPFNNMSPLAKSQRTAVLDNYNMAQLCISPDNNKNEFIEIRLPKIRFSETNPFKSKRNQAQPLLLGCRSHSSSFMQRNEYESYDSLFLCNTRS